MTAYILNLFDLACTLFALNLGVKELNLLIQNVPVMVFYKTVIVGVLCWWAANRKEPIARVGLLVCTAVYAALGMWHIWGLFMLKKGGRLPVTEWEVFELIVAVVGFLVVIFKIATPLTQAITKLTVIVESLDEDLREQKEKSRESHRKLWEHSSELDRRVDEHDLKFAEHDLRLAAHDKVLQGYKENE